MSDQNIREIVIVGGGAAGWMTAAAFARFLDKTPTRICLIESDEIGIVGVGEATVPVIQAFNGVLGLDERAFLKKTKGTFKLGIEFRDWGWVGNEYFHAFGDFGDSIEGVSPHHHWLKLHRSGDEGSLFAHSFTYAAGKLNRFAPPPVNPRADQPSYKYAYHFDAALYAQFLRGYAEAKGVERIEGKVTDVALRGADGFIDEIRLEGGRVVQGDFFVDCTGFAALLMSKTLGDGYVDWSHWLPCDRAAAVPCASGGDFTPYTRSTAHKAGWQWRIPLQHRTGNGYVYASNCISDDEAASTLLANLDGDALAPPRLLKFKTGRREHFWIKNCVSIGLASGFMEPLESTSLQLIQTAIARIIEMFPDKSFDPVLIGEYNRVTISEVERVRDFLILHYKAGRRDDSELWRYCRDMAIPDELAHKIEVFESFGRVAQLADESYMEPSWVSILVGSGIIPRRYDPLIDRIDVSALKQKMAARRASITRTAAAMPTHAAFLAAHCGLSPDFLGRA